MTKETQITISGNEYRIKKTYRSLLLFEELTGKGITEMQQSLKDLLQLFYCIVQANNTIDFTFSEFVQMIDDEPQVMDVFNDYLVNSATTVETTPIKKKKQNQSR
jgi:hypothetical protein